MKKILSMLFLCCTTTLIVACTPNKESSDSTSINKETVESPIHTNTKEHDHLDYDHQEKWEAVSGKMQSPINILTNKTEMIDPDTGKITLNYDKEMSKIENNGHSIQVTSGGTSVINGRHFELKQYHFHAESEHTIDGKHYPIEAHFVNMSQSGRLAVIGVFFKEGVENKGFQQVLDSLADHSIEPMDHLEEMIPKNYSYYHYLGSLTTPPLTENVEWYVMKEPVEVSSTQIEEFKKLYSQNNRKVQPLQDRVVLAYEE